MSSNRQTAGFTLVELIVVLVIIGVLAVSLVPRFFSAAGTSEYLYQDQLLNLLRRAQIQAMQCTDCSTPAVTLSANTVLLGTASCNDIDAGLALCVAPGEAVTLTPDGSISFDNLGRPSCSAASCTISVQGEVTLRICTEEEGYIHPC